MLAQSSIDSRTEANDHAKRRECIEWIIEQQIINADVSNEIIFNDEAHFNLSGFVNRQIIAFEIQKSYCLETNASRMCHCLVGI